MGKKRYGVEPHGKRVRITFTYEGQRCRETLNIPPTDKNLDYGERKRSAILYEIEVGSFDYAATFPDSPRAQQARRKQDRTLGAGVEIWLKTRVLTATSRSRYLRAIRKHVHGLNKDGVAQPGALGPRPMRTIMASELETWRAQLANVLRPKTVNNLMTVVRGAFDLAHADGAIPSNPASRLVNVKNYGKGGVDPFQPAELGAILEQFRGAEYNMVDLWWTSGLRGGEIYGLQWQDVDWMGKRLHIERAFVENKAVLTKTKRDRWVDLNDRALDALKRQRALTELQGGFVFLNPDTGEAYSHAVVFYRKWQRALRRAKVRHRPPKQLRHTYASMSLSMGEPPIFIMRQLGHTSLTMLEKHYAEYMDKVNASIGQGFNKLARQVPGSWGTGGANGATA